MVCVGLGVKCVGVCWEVVWVDRNDVEAGQWSRECESERASERARDTEKAWLEAGTVG
jgi:hypothetical protein